ncbi:MAG: Flp pilus assembly pilin Flp [Bacteriovoracaceae bacterium]|jgi:Flp pilus assembly pilin Flp
MNENTNKKIKDQSGQTLVEFVLLLLAIVVISTTFMTQINGYIANRWEAVANVILDDPNQQIKLR